jgi:Uma2 family endonuclease
MRKVGAMSSQPGRTNTPLSRTGEPAWEVATLFPVQGEWTEEEFLALETAHFIELADGHIEVLSMPTWLHQLIVKYLVQQLEAWLNGPQNRTGERGTVLFAPLPLRLFPKTVREPDVMYLRPQHLPDNLRGYPQAADLVMEVLSESPKDRDRDLVTKREEYARAGIAEYWIVDPRDRRISVLSLAENVYRIAGEYGPGQIAESSLLPGFTVEASAVWALEKKTSD